MPQEIERVAEYISFLSRTRSTSYYCSTVQRSTMLCSATRPIKYICTHILSFCHVARSRFLRLGDVSAQKDEVGSMLDPATVGVRIRVRVS